jgi:hypothetical protein
MALRRRRIDEERGCDRMTPLVDALETLGLTAEVELKGRWVRLAGDCGAVFVTASTWGDSYYTWCDIPDQRAVQRYNDPVEAIRAGLHRASRHQGSPAPPFEGSGDMRPR